MDKMKRLSNMLLVSAMLMTGWAQAEQMPMVAADDLAANLGAMEMMGDDATTRGCNIKHFGKVIACDVIAGRGTFDNLVVNNDLTVYGNEEIEGNLTVDGDLIVRGDYVPLTINITPGTDQIINALNGLSDDIRNFGSVVINMAPGTYTETSLIFGTQVQAVTFVGDTHPLAGVGFMQGGIYGGPAYNVQRQLNPEIGRGCDYNIAFDATGTIMTVSALDNTCLMGNFSLVQPDFSGLEGREILFIGTDGIITPHTVLSVSANMITFTAAVAPTVVGTNTAGTPSALGVAFAVSPNVIVVDAAPDNVNSSLTGIKNLEILGVYFFWNNPLNDLYLGGVNTKMELSNCIFRTSGNINNVIYVSAGQAYNRQPNTFIEFCGVTATSMIDFVFNSVWARQFVISSASGSFSYAQGNYAALELLDGAQVSLDYARLYNSNQLSAISIENGSVASANNAIVANSASRGISVLNSSTLATSGTQPVSVMGSAGFGLVLDFASAALIVGADNPTEFSLNALGDLSLDGVVTANINTYVSGTFGLNYSYVIK